MWEESHGGSGGGGSIRRKMPRDISAAGAHAYASAAAGGSPLVRIAFVPGMDNLCVVFASQPETAAIAAEL